MPNSSDKPTYRHRLAKYLGCSLEELADHAPNYPPPTRDTRIVRNANDFRRILLRLKAIHADSDDTV